MKVDNVFCPVRFSLLWLVDSVKHWNQLFFFFFFCVCVCGGGGGRGVSGGGRGACGEGAGCFAFLWPVACVLSVMICLLFFWVSLVGNDLWLCLFLNIFYIIFMKADNAQISLCQRAEQ